MEWTKDMIKDYATHEDIYSKLNKNILKKPLNPFLRFCDRISFAEGVIDIESLFEKKKIIKLALISLQIPLPKETKPFYTVDCNKVDINRDSREEERHKVDRQACLRKFAHFSRKDSKYLLDQYESALTFAFKDVNVDIACVNELGFPSSNAKPLSRARVKAKELVKKYEGIIIVGTSHDILTRYNSGYIFYPGRQCGRYGAPFHKQVSAIQENEMISTPAQRNTLLFRAFGFRMGVLVCLDLCDFSTIASIIKSHGNSVDLLFVPACTESIDVMDKVAKIISVVIGGGVAITNRCNVGRPSTAMYLCGDKAEHFGIQRIEIPVGDAWVTTYDINRFELLNLKYDSETKLNADLAWLFNRYPHRVKSK